MVEVLWGRPDEASVCLAERVSARGTPAGLSVELEVDSRCAGEPVTTFAVSNRVDRIPAVFRVLGMPDTAMVDYAVQYALEGPR